MLPKRWHVLMLESASEVNAASEKREKEEETNEERERERKIKRRTIRGFEANSTLLT